MDSEQPGLDGPAWFEGVPSPAGLTSTPGVSGWVPFGSTLVGASWLWQVCS